MHDYRAKVPGKPAQLVRAVNPKEAAAKLAVAESLKKGQELYAQDKVGTWRGYTVKGDRPRALKCSGVYGSFPPM